MRGKLMLSADSMSLSGITPADAGKTSRGNAAILVGKDHPRGCGENPHRTLLQENIRGSPPRMRGKH